MEFGRTGTLEGVDLSLPPDHPDTLALLGAKKPSSLHHPEVRLGLAKWGDEVAPRLYKKGKREKQPLVEYSRIFNSIELNATGHGYRAHLFPKWAEQTPPGFKFYPKVPRDITHKSNLEQAGELYENFCQAAEGLGDRLGALHLQFEDRSFGPKRFKELEAFLRAHGARLPVVVEVRHKDWFAKEKHREEYFGLLTELGIGAVIVDVPDRRDLLHQRLTIPEAFIRFSGHDRGDRDLARVEEWARRIKVWMDLGLRRLNLFTHHVPDHVSADWAVDFTATLNRICGTKLKVPPLIPAEPEEPQVDLFGAG